MRICFVAPSSSVHIEKWCNYFSAAGHDISVITFDWDDLSAANTYHLKQNAVSSSGDLSKLAYLTCGSQLKTYLDAIDPDIVHAHYASSYGALCALACDRPYYLSVWGSDVYEFPQKSPLHKALLKYSLKRASFLMSTSHAMAVEAGKYTDKLFQITPFGVDLAAFCPGKTNADYFTVGTVKGLSKKYGISTLLEGCARALEKQPDMPLRIRIAGKGPQEEELKVLSNGLGLAERIEWLGFVDASEVPSIWQSLNVALIPSESESESFGVSAVEAQACGVPVVISDIPGLMEATDVNRSSVVIHRGDAEQLANAIVDLYDSETKRETMGKQGREFVAQNYEIGRCFDRVLQTYLRGLDA